MSHVMRPDRDGQWEVGSYTPDGGFLAVAAYPKTDEGTKEAMMLVNYLNGGLSTEELQGLGHNILHELERTLSLGLQVFEGVLRRNSNGS